MAVPCMPCRTAVLWMQWQRAALMKYFYFQVDNPLVKIADPLFVGAHIDRQRRDVNQGRAQDRPVREKVGIIGRVNGRLGCIEYSELTAEQAAEQLPGRLPALQERQYRRAYA